MTKGFVIGTGCLLTGIVISVLVYDGMRATRLENQQNAAVMEQIRRPVDWPGQELTDDPAFQPFDRLYVNLSTSWGVNDTGDATMQYAVSLVPAKLTDPTALAALAQLCRFSLSFNDSQGMLVTTVPLAVTPAPGPDGKPATLAITDSIPMSAAVYADMVGAHADAESGTIEGTADVAGQCQPPPPVEGPGRH